jgi:hypothetical protein
MDGAGTTASPQWRFFLGFSPAHELVVADAKGAVSKVRWINVDGIAKSRAVIVRALTMQA